MDVTSAISRINYVLRGIDDDAPTSGTDEYTYWLDTLNTIKDYVYRDSGKRWSFAFSTTAPNEPGTVATSGTTTLTGTGTNFTDYNTGDTITVSGETARTIDTISSDTSLTVTVAFDNTVTANTFTHTPIIASGVQSHNLHRRFVHPSDRPYVIDSNAKTHYLEYVDPQDRNSTTLRRVYIDGVNPKTFTVTTTIDSTEDIVGGTLYVPGYFNVPDLSEATDLLPVPDPNYMVYATAAEIAFNDITYEDKAPDLNAKANDLWRRMVRSERAGIAGDAKTFRTNIRRIRGY